ncbi:polymerase delta-interacting protein 3 isoform X2 [Sarcophilus harrisii]|uniref:polymerase delta-interacting protein 3 isoform X2 n=1 Tax=Sarcophilus harrisii TaxID=9305 RepID=UPI001301FEC5|nr:polymerase delta-interacting protein 3 isoform X2 [Sarcophilus harrisii]
MESFQPWGSQSPPARLNARPGIGGIRSRIGLPQALLNRPMPAPGFQQIFDARQKIGLTDARQKLGVKDAREKLVQKDARFRIKGKVQDAREMLNSRKHQTLAAEKGTKVIDAREKISLKRSSPGSLLRPAASSLPPTMKITKTIQFQIAWAATDFCRGPSWAQSAGDGAGTRDLSHVKPRVLMLSSVSDLALTPQKAALPILPHPAGMRINVVNNHQHKQSLYDVDEDEEAAVPIPSKQMKLAGSPSFLQHMAGFSSSKFSLSKALPLTKVVQNDTYTALPAPPSPLRTKALTNMSRTLVTKEDPPKELSPAEPIFSPLEGTKMTVNNLHPRVTEEDIVELFCVCGALKRARLVHPGVAEVVFVKKEDAITAYKKYNNRCLDGQPMKCNLHVNGSVITSDQPILLRLSDSPLVKKEGESRRLSSSASSHPPAEVDPDTILKALFKSSGASVSVQPTEFKIKL